MYAWFRRPLPLTDQHAAGPAEVRVTPELLPLVLRMTWVCEPARVGAGTRGHQPNLFKFVFAVNSMVVRAKSEHKNVMFPKTCKMLFILNHSSLQDKKGRPEVIKALLHFRLQLPILDRHRLFETVTRKNHISPTTWDVLFFAD